MRIGFDFAGVRWLRIVLTAIVVFVASMAITVLIVFGYAFALGAQVRGQPDQQLISEFANRFAPTFGPVLLILFTPLGAWRVARGGKDPVLHGVLVGLISAILGLLPGWPPDFTDLMTFAAVLVGGWIGGLIGGRPRTPVAH